MRMMSGQVIWCDRCGAYGTHRGCGLARPCLGHAVMGSGGGKWQRLLLLREGRHPKDKSWIGAPIPESAWSMSTVSSVNTALSEVRRRDKIFDQKVATQPTSTSSTSRFELVRQRVRQKELGASGRLVSENRIADSSTKTTCAGMPVSNQSRFEAMRQRIKTNEIRATGGLRVTG